ncbi:MAG: hypothetical protein HND56_00950 [Pseudomonadota bacterium]|nr:hypothetical protein [Pseudomonadota bacterium]QKK04334.1 MAG: hypothetical protein HND56_00950 [Pseudomonadota bacterium]
MDYSIQDLASKMGFEVLSEDGQYTASYSDAANPMINGVAEIRMEEDGRLFSASLYHRRGDYEADDGQIYKDYEENVEIRAMRIGSGDVFRIIHMELDGQTHHAGNQAMIELGLCIFHSRIVDIQEGAAAQYIESAMAVNAEAQSPVLGHFRENMDFSPQRSTGVVIAFPGRRAEGHKQKGLTV